MAFKQYTKCIEPSKYKPNRIAIILGYGAVAGSTATGMISLSGRWDCWPIVPEIIGMAMVVGYCENWLYARLLCLGGDVDCVGAIVSIEPPSADLIFSSGDDVFDLDWDTDYSINLLLENCEFGISQADAEKKDPYGYLLAPQNTVTAIGLKTPGYTAEDKKGTMLKSAVLHAEFEGAGNYILLQAADAALGLAFGALLACFLLPFPLSLISALLPLLVLIIGALFGNYSSGSPSDVGVEGELEGNSENNNGMGFGADIVYVQGTWVYDPLHEGWNEIHPIKICTKVGKWDGSWSTSPDVILRIKKAFEVAQADETRINQARPEHQWQLHPVLDGCASDIIL